MAALAAGRRVTSAGKTAGTAGSLADLDLAGRRVLVADDNIINREVIIEVLLQLGMAVESVENGREAVEAWRRLKPDFIFMDCSMPEMDGYEATREIRAHERLDLATDPVPIVRSPPMPAAPRAVTGARPA
ncbi:MAG: response regulator [Alphaproteobacteria bacterium]|nr:response regulator [Alphaproteobacteria bacterium]